MSTEHWTPGGERMYVSDWLLSFVWQELTNDPTQTCKALARKANIKSPSQIHFAITVLRAQGRIGDKKLYEVLEPFQEQPL